MFGLFLFFYSLLKDSGRWSLSPGDDFSSGVFSYNSQPDVQVYSVDLLSHSQLPPPCCFEGEIKHQHPSSFKLINVAPTCNVITFGLTPCVSGVDVCIRDFNRRSIRIRETRRVKVGHIATGISDQVRA